MQNIGGVYKLYVYTAVLINTLPHFHSVRMNNFTTAALHLLSALKNPFYFYLVAIDNKKTPQAKTLTIL